VLHLAEMHGLPSVSRDPSSKVDPTISGDCAQEEDSSILDALVQTILSQNTTDVQSHKGFADLQAAYPTWDAVRKAPPAKIEAVVKSCGLAEIKVARIQAILNTLHTEHGGGESPTLRHCRTVHC
jgi:endonuclease-3